MSRHRTMIRVWELVSGRDATTRTWPLLASPSQCEAKISRIRHFILSATMATVAWAAACGDGGTEPEPPPQPNRVPVASGSFPAQTMTVGQSATINVASSTTGPDDEMLV